ncbi:MAG: hypothetical protein EOM90_15320 [Alphaproteobacteria bacterium]|nr:hypothetical protein [Alphaproteobacteria bacterium]
MKATMILLTTFLILQSTVLWAKTPKKGALKSESFIGEVYINIEKLAPTLIINVAFIDGTEITSEKTISIDVLAPVTPKEAEFEEVQPEQVDLEKLAPSMPSVTEFEEIPETLIPDPTTILPAAPTEAEFQD